MNLLFVCTGNICRTPMAVAIARDALARAGKTGVVVSSAGTYAIVGSGPTSDAVRVAKEHGLSLAGHRARQLTGELLRDADLVVGMEDEHAAFARRLGAADVTTLGAPVRDPYALGLVFYRETWELLTSLVPVFLGTIREPRE